MTGDLEVIRELQRMYAKNAAEKYQETLMLYGAAIARGELIVCPHCDGKRNGYDGIGYETTCHSCVWSPDGRTVGVLKCGDCGKRPATMLVDDGMGGIFLCDECGKDE